MRRAQTSSTVINTGSTALISIAVLVARTVTAPVSALALDMAIAHTGRYRTG